MIKCNNRFCCLYTESRPSNCSCYPARWLVAKCKARQHYDLVMPIPEYKPQPKKGTAAMQKAKKVAKKAAPAKKPVVAKKAAKGKK